MYREAIKIEARQYSELADLSLIPQMKLEYYIELKERYRFMIDPRAKELPPKPGGPVFEAGSGEAMAAFRAVGSAHKHALGFSSEPATVRDYGRR